MVETVSMTILAPLALRLGIGDRCFLQFPAQKNVCLELKAVNLELLANAEIAP